MSRTIITDQRSPSTSTARVIGQYWPYPLSSLTAHLRFFAPATIIAPIRRWVQNQYRFSTDPALAAVQLQSYRRSSARVRTIEGALQ
jgi:hypothetical protein